MSSGAWRRYARCHAPEGPRDAVRVLPLDEGPRARVRGEADHGRVPGTVRVHDPRPARHSRPHARRRVQLARAVTTQARGRMEEGALRRRLPASGRPHRSLAPQRAGNARVARDARRRHVATDPRPRAGLAAEGAFSALVLRFAHPRAYPAAAERRGRVADAVPAVAREYRLPRLRRSRPQANARGLTRTIARARAT